MVNTSVHLVYHGSMTTDRSLQKQKTRRKLLESAIELSAEKGFVSLSLREVSKKAGITPAGFYKHFHDMDELGLALIDEVGLGLRQLLRESRRTVDLRGSAVRASVEAFIHYITENQNLFRVLQGERQGSSTPFRKAIFAEMARFMEEVADDLDRASTLLNQPLRDAGLAAEVIVAVAFTLGGEVLDLPKHRRGELVERLIKEVKMVLRGALAPKADTIKKLAKYVKISKKLK
jgi:AcrR family transcriptional regulator